MRLDEQRRQALLALFENLGEAAEPPVSEGTRQRFERLQSRIQGEERRRAAAETLVRLRDLARRIREGLEGDALAEALSKMRLDLESGRPGMLAAYRSLETRGEDDQQEMLKDLLLLQKLIQEADSDGTD
jgi:hypothetical protein